MTINKLYYFFVSGFILIGLVCFFLIKNNIISDNINLLFFCFFLIFTLGASHGALDHLRGKKILKPILNAKWSIFFYPGYILLASSVICLWLLSPPITLFIFLMISAYHFGEEDMSFFINGDGSFFYLISFLKGLLVITLALFFNLETTSIFFGYLMVNLDNYTFVTQFASQIFYANIALFLIGVIVLLRGNFSKLFLITLEILLTIFAFIYLPLILAFSLYFCFIHSTKHILRQSKELDRINLINGLKLFSLRALPLTLLTAIGAILFVFFLQSSLTENLIKTIFIGLASLTLPHIILEVFERYNVR